MTPKEALEVGNKVWTGYRVVTLKENHRIDSTTKWWHIEEDNYEYREDRFEEIPIYVQNLLKALTELEELKRYPTSDEVVVISLNHEDVRKSIGKNDVKSVAIQNDYITIQQAKDKVHEELVRDVKRYFEFGLYVKASDKKEYDELIERLKKVGTKE